MPDSPTVLVVDDDETTRELLTLMLGSHGWLVSEADSGEAALHTIKEAAALPDVILSDLQMPGLCGSDMATAIRESIPSHSAKQPLLIAMTATVTAKIPAGFDDLVIKPFPPEDLLAHCQAKWNATDITREATTQAPQVPDVIVLDTFERIRASMAADQVRSLYDFALQDAELRVHHMAEAEAAGDDARYRSSAHALKGSCAMIGAQHLRNLAAEAELRGLTTTITLTGLKPLSQFHEAISNIRHMLERILAS